MKPADALRLRTKQFAVRIVRLFQALPATDEARTLGKQLLRSGTSVAANYRAVCRARSKAEFLAKLGIVVDEIDETVFWLELFTETGVLRAARMGNIFQEANEPPGNFRYVSNDGEGDQPALVVDNSSIRNSGNPSIILLSL